jgi:dethiobiotin synthetase
VLIVVALRLGCLNHAALTARAIGSSGLPICGWVANRLDRHFPEWPENVAALKRLIPAPLIGVLDHQQPRVSITEAARSLNIDALLDP